MGKKQKQSRNKTLKKKYNSVSSLTRAHTGSNTFMSKTSALQKSKPESRTKSRAKRLERSMRKSSAGRVNSLMNFRQNNNEGNITAYPYSTDQNSEL